MIPFFQFVDDRVGADPQHPRRVAYAAAIERHVDYPDFDIGQQPVVGVIQNERPFRAFPV